MAFNQVPGKVDFVEQEKQVLGFWQETKAFERCRAIHRGQPHWSFIDGPITANNPMGVHHGWGRTYKDVFNRYWTMRGRELRYQNGFDCQGLWVEVEVEKELGFASKKDIIDYGLDRFVLKCKERVLRYAAVQTEQSIRLGYWMDWNDPERLRWMAEKLIEDPSQVLTIEGPDGPVSDTIERLVGRLGMPELGGSYYTLSTENNYMIWTFLKKCWANGWLYRGADVMPWCPRCATGISQHEIVTDGYADLTHAAVTVRFPLRDRAGEALLVWTTTPWTLSSNVAAAVGPELTYVKVENKGEVVYLSEGTLHMLRGEYTILDRLSGKDMEGWAYDGPFDYLEAAQMPGGCTELDELVAGLEINAVQAHRVLLWDEVGVDEGTGIVHIAPGCGAEDFTLGREYHLPVVAPLGEEGHFLEHFGWLTGMHVSDVTQPIFDDLQKRGLLYRVKDYMHRYPICWRCKTELVFRLVDEWYISMDELRHKMMAVTRQIRWIPSFGLDRELDWLRNMHDWMISKKRFWGLALPFWECPDCGHTHVVQDEDELRELAVEGWDVFEGHTPHRPFIDAVKIACPNCGATMSRINDVGNPWLDAGIVSFSTLQYRTDKDYWKEWYPANWISESFPGQFRNWFYSLLAMATVIDDSPPFLENFSYATLLAENGSPMHKSSGNMIEFNDAADKMGVDVMRWLFCAHKPESNLLFGYNRADETRRHFFIPLWNVYKFFITYAKIDEWTPTLETSTPGAPEGDAPRGGGLLDRWIVARINQVVERCTKALEDSDAYAATMTIELLMDDLTNWYVRRSRRRFWKSEHDSDKETAYATLHYVLVRLLRVLAPITPFVTEVMYQNLVRGVYADAYGSVHHCDWPAADTASIDSALLGGMALARRVASLGLGARNAASIKVRQPLAKALIYAGGHEAELSAELLAIVADELNVKDLDFVKSEGDLVTYRAVANGKQLGPKYGKLFPKVRAALSALDADEVVSRIQDGLPVSVVVDGQTVEVLPDEIIIDKDPVEGLAVSSDQTVTVAIDSVITAELRAEGAVRDIVRQVQNLRKDADYALDDRVTVGVFRLTAELCDAIDAFGDYMRQETLCTQLLTEDDEAAWDRTADVKIGGVTIGLAVRR